MSFAGRLVNKRRRFFVLHHAILAKFFHTLVSDFRESFGKRFLSYWLFSIHEFIKLILAQPLSTYRHHTLIYFGNTILKSRGFLDKSMFLLKVIFWIKRLFHQ